MPTKAYSRFLLSRRFRITLKITTEKDSRSRGINEHRAWLALVRKRLCCPDSHMANLISRPSPLGPQLPTSAHMLQPMIRQEAATVVHTLTINGRQSSTRLCYTVDVPSWKNVNQQGRLCYCRGGCFWSFYSLHTHSEISQCFSYPSRP